jgi:hypothetical protein
LPEESAAQTFPVLEPEGPVAREPTSGERYATLVNIYKFQYFATYRHIAKRFGWEAAIQIADEAIPYIAEGYRRKFDLPGEGAALVAQVHATEMLVEGADVAIVTDTRAASECHVLCPWGQAIQSGKFADAEPINHALCNLNRWRFMQRVGETVSRHLYVDRKAWMGDGAARCHFSIRRREPAYEPVDA